MFGHRHAHDEAACAQCFGSGRPFGGHHRDGGRGGRLDRVFDHGDLRYVLLHLIAEKPRHGYELIKAIEDKFGGMYSPSPGVIYPTLTLLEELGHLSVETAGGTRKLYSMTAEGTTFLAANRALVDAILGRMAERAGPMPAARPGDPARAAQSGDGIVDPARQRPARRRAGAGHHPGARSRRGGDRTHLIATRGVAR